MVHVALTQHFLYTTKIYKTLLFMSFDSNILI